MIRPNRVTCAARRQCGCDSSRRGVRGFGREVRPELQLDDPRSDGLDLPQSQHGEVQGMVGRGGAGPLVEHQRPRGGAAPRDYHIKAILLINKIDIYDTETIELVKRFIKIYEYAGYDCIEISVKNRYQIPLVNNLMKDKLSLIAGNSGVGKSSLINLLCPGLNLKTEIISSYHLSGKHATTYPEMFKLPQGGYIIDSPGIRGFGVIDIAKNETGLYFIDIFNLSKDCQFTNCTHVHEPGCAVIKAYKSGVLHESRYRSYLKIFSDSNKKYRTG